MLLLVAAQMLAHHRMDAVAADQRVGTQVLAGLQRTSTPSLSCDTADAARAEALRLRRDRVEQDLDQVGAMDVVHRRAVAPRRFVAERGLVQHSAGAQVAIIVGLRLDADGADRRSRPISRSTIAALLAIWMPAPISAMTSACSSTSASMP